MLEPQIVPFKAAVDVTLHLHACDGQGHGFFNSFDGNNPMFAETVREMDRLAGEPSIDQYVYDGPGTTNNGT